MAPFGPTWDNVLTGIALSRPSLDHFRLTRAQLHNRWRGLAQTFQELRRSGSRWPGNDKISVDFEHNLDLDQVAGEFGRIAAILRILIWQRQPMRRASLRRPRARAVRGGAPRGGERLRRRDGGRLVEGEVRRRSAAVPCHTASARVSSAGHCRGLALEDSRGVPLRAGPFCGACGGHGRATRRRRFALSCSGVRCRSPLRPIGRAPMVAPSVGARRF